MVAGMKRRATWMLCEWHQLMREAMLTFQAPSSSAQSYVAKSFHSSYRPSIMDLRSGFLSLSPQAYSPSSPKFFLNTSFLDKLSLGATIAGHSSGDACILQQL